MNAVKHSSKHGEFHELMTANDMSYVAIKDLASERYYLKPNLRLMGGWTNV